MTQRVPTAGSNDPARILADELYVAQQRTAQLRRDMAGRDTAARLLAQLV